MPRHPPCALDNLTNTPANITKNHTAHRLQEVHDMSYELFRQKYSTNQRCSRPLCNSQRPHGHRHTPANQPAATEPPPREHVHPTTHPQQPGRPRGRSSPQDPTVCRRSFTPKRDVVFPLVSRATPHAFPNNPPPEDRRLNGTGEALHPHMRWVRTLAGQPPHPQVFGEAP